MLLIARFFVIAAVLWTAIGTIRNYPYQLSYFNELSGGTASGDYHLLGSGFEVGQDLGDLSSALSASASGSEFARVPVVGYSTMLPLESLFPNLQTSHFPKPKAITVDGKLCRRALVVVSVEWQRRHYVDTPSLVRACLACWDADANVTASLSRSGPFWIVLIEDQ